MSMVFDDKANYVTLDVTAPLGVSIGAVDETLVENERLKDHLAKTTEYYDRLFAEYDRLLGTVDDLYAVTIDGVDYVRKDLVREWLTLQK